MQTFDYSNKYGTLTLHAVTDLMPISQVSYAKQKETIDEVCFSIDDAEMIALITGNRYIQICAYSSKICYVVYHESPSNVYICRAEIKECKLPNDLSAQRVLELENKNLHIDI